MALRRNVLIFHTGALGDFVLTWPLAVALGRLHPQSRIFYVTHAGKGKLAEKALGIDSIDIEGGWHALHAEGAELPAAGEKHLASAHTVLSFVSDGHDAWTQNVNRLAPEASLITLATPPRGTIAGGQHVSEFFVEQLTPYPALATATRQIVRSVTDRGIGGRMPADGRVVIHPGSGSATKCWPLTNFIALAERLKAVGRQVEFVLGETELEKWTPADRQRLSEAAPVKTPSDLVGLYQLVRSASCFVGNDSGPGHLAGIVGVRTVVIFGPGDPRSWRAMGPAVKVLQGDAVSVDDVAAAVSE